MQVQGTQQQEANSPQRGYSGTASLGWRLRWKKYRASSFSCWTGVHATLKFWCTCNQNAGVYWQTVLAEACRCSWGHSDICACKHTSPQSPIVLPFPYGRDKTSFAVMLFNHRLPCTAEVGCFGHVMLLTYLM